MLRSWTRCEIFGDIVAGTGLARFTLEFRAGKVSRAKWEGMDMRRVILALVGSLAVPTGFVIALPLAVALPTGSAFAANPPAPGTITCMHVTGKVTFTPPLTLAGNSTSEVTKTRTTSTGCTVSRGTAPTKGVSTSTITKTTTNTTANSCTALATAQVIPVTEHVVWTHTPLIANSTVKFSGLMPATSASGDAGFSLPNSPGGTASVTGSYPGTDHGATSTAAVFTNMTATQIATLCSSATGVASLTISSGSATLK